MNAIKVANVVAKAALDEATYKHTIRVVTRSQNDQEAVVAYLHDVVEDSRVTLKDLIDLGFDGYTVHSVDALTRRDPETYTDYITRIAESDAVAVAVKIADLRDHLEQSATLKPSLKVRYDKAMTFLAGRI